MKQTSGVLWLRNLSQLLMWKTKAMNLGVLVPLLWSLVPSPSESWCQPKPRIQISGIPITNCQPIFQSDGNLKRAQIDANSNFDRNVCVCHKMGVSSIPKGSSLCFHVNGHFLVSNAKLSEASFVSSEALKCWRLASWCHPTWGSISRKMSNPLVNYHNYGKSPFFMGKFTISMVIFHSYVMLVCQRVSEFEPYPHHSAS